MTDDIITSNANNMDTNDTDDGTKKLGKLFGGFCCDMRRAVIITSIIGIVLSVASYVGNVLLVFNHVKDPSLFYSSEVISRIDSINILQVIMTVLVICGYISSIVGAIQFNYKYVLCNSIYILIYFTVLAFVFIQTAMNIPDFSYITLLLPFIQCVVTVAANTPFCKEVKAGIMTKETYPIREKYSRCCV